MEAGSCVDWRAMRKRTWACLLGLLACSVYLLARSVRHPLLARSACHPLLAPSACHPLLAPSVCQPTCHPFDRWDEPDGRHLALSFQDDAGCLDIWQQICQVGQQKDATHDGCIVTMAALPVWLHCHYGCIQPRLTPLACAGEGHDRGCSGHGRRGRPGRPVLLGRAVVQACLGAFVQACLGALLGIGCFVLLGFALACSCSHALPGHD